MQVPASPPPGEGRSHYEALDGLRAVAVLMVIAYHTFRHIRIDPDSPGWRAASVLMKSGWLGVDLFFVLSGFLITEILLRTRESPRYFSSFFGRRVVRIFPVYLVTLAIVAGVLPMVGFHLLEPREGRLPLYLLYINNIGIAGIGWGRQAINHFWSLAVEEQFYLLWPLAVALLSRKGLALLCIGGMVIAPALRWALWYHEYPLRASYVLLPTRMDGLLVGALLAVYWPRLRESSNGPGRASAVMMLAGAAILQGLLWRCGRITWQVNDPWSQALLFTGGALLFGGLVLAALAAGSGTLLHRALSARWTKPVSRYSYAMYILHLPLLVVMKQSGHYPRDTAFEGGALFLYALAFATLNALLTFALAALSWRFLEEPCLRLKRYFRY